MALREYDSAFEDIKKHNLSSIPFLKSAEGYIYLIKGQPAQADVIFREANASLEKSISSHQPDAALYYSHLYLAMNYSALGEKEKALAYLKEVNNKKTYRGISPVTCKITLCSTTFATNLNSLNCQKNLRESIRRNIKELLHCSGKRGKYSPCKNIQNFEIQSLRIIRECVTLFEE
jgi:tetratricopeptide (TPR) repeat protein